MGHLPEPNRADARATSVRGRGSRRASSKRRPCPPKPPSKGERVMSEGGVKVNPNGKEYVSATESDEEMSSKREVTFDNVAAKKMRK